MLMSICLFTLTNSNVNLFQYGTIEHVGVSKKRLRALIAFQSASEAVSDLWSYALCVCNAKSLFFLTHFVQLNSLEECGFAESPLSVSWFAGKQPAQVSTASYPTYPCTSQQLQDGHSHSLEDNEALVFSKLRQAQKQKETTQLHNNCSLWYMCI